MRTSIHRVTLALDGKVDYMRHANPWGSGGSSEVEKTPRPDPAAAATALRDILGARASRGGRIKRPK